MNYETSEERTAQEAERLTIPPPKFTPGQVVCLKGSRYSTGVIHNRMYSIDESLWFYSVLRGDTMQTCGYLAEYALKACEEKVL